MIAWLLAGLLVLPHLAFGAIAPWARLSLFLAAVALFTVWILQAARTGSLHLRRDPIWWFLLAFWALLFLQVLPLPASVAPRGSGGTISISAFDTRISMLRVAAFSLIFVVAANAIRRRGEVKLLLIALTAAGAGEALFGFSAYFSGQRYPPWLPGAGPLGGVMGTFPHKNYFSGFLEMIVPVAIGFLVFLGQKRREVWATMPDRPLARRFLSYAANPVLFQQFILAIGIVVMIAGIAFSLCRAGILVLFATLAAFLALLGFSRLSKRYVFAILIIGGLAALVGFSIGLDKVISGVEDAGFRESGSWLHRWDMTKSALGIVRDFPLFGTGLGTTDQVFTRYQSGQHADLQVRYFHNDILQLAGETGIVGWLIVAIGGVWFLARAALNLRRRHDPFSKWVGTGALLGVGAMLFHSFFEHNLGKVTSNGIVFTLLLAIAWVCSRGVDGRHALDGRDVRRIDLGRPALRGALASGSVAVCVLAFVFVLPLIRAELAINRDPYFFLPTAAGESDAAAGPRVALALALAPSNHRIRYAAAVQALRAAEETVRRGAVALLGFEPAPQDDKDVDKIVQVLLKNLPPGLAAARTTALSTAQSHLDEAVRLAPAMADYHFLRGVTLYDLGGASPEVFAEVETAVRLAPKVPRILFGAGNLLLDAGWDASGSERAALWSKARLLLRESLRVDPSYAALAYPELLKAFGVKGLIEVTPSTIRASEALYKILLKENRWEEALALLVGMERLASERFGGETEPVVDHDEEAVPGPAAEDDDMAKIGKGFDRRTEAELRRSLIQRQALLLGLLGRWPERRAAAARYRRVLREDSVRQMQEVGTLRRQGRSDEALRRCQMILEQDWSYPAALLEAAELATLPGVRTDAAPWSDSLDHLYRLVLYNRELTADETRRLKAVLDRIIPRSRQEQVKKEFIGGVAAVLGGSPEAGLRALQQLAGGIGAAEAPWGQGHLIRYYLGRGLEKTSRKDDAVRAYRSALELLPNHLPSLQRLAVLEPEGRAGLAEFEPDVKLYIRFDGRVTLLGYSFENASAGPGRGGASVTFFWEFTERTEAKYKPAIRIGAFGGAPVFANRNAIIKESVPYRIDAPSSGEVVTENYPLPANLGAGAYLRVAVVVPGSSQSLYHDLGNGTLTVALK